MSNFFTMEHPFWQFMAKLGWAVVFNFIFIITSLPVITIGASITALNTVMMKIARDEGGQYFSMYLKAWLHSFVSSTISWVLSAFIGLWLYVNVYLMWSESMTVLFWIALVGCFAVLMFIQTVFALTARFEGSWWETITRARLVWTQDFGFVALAALFNLVIVVGIGWSVASMNIFSWLVILWFGLAALINAFIYNHIFHKYSEEEAEEEAAPEQPPEDPFAKLRGEYKE